MNKRQQTIINDVTAALEYTENELAYEVAFGSGKLDICYKRILQAMRDIKELDNPKEDPIQADPAQDVNLLENALFRIDQTIYLLERQIGGNQPEPKEFIDSGNNLKSLANDISRALGRNDIFDILPF